MSKQSINTQRAVAAADNAKQVLSATAKVVQAMQALATLAEDSSCSASLAAFETASNLAASNASSVYDTATSVLESAEYLASQARVVAQELTTIAEIRKAEDAVDAASDRKPAVDAASDLKPADRFFNSMQCMVADKEKLQDELLDLAKTPGFDHKVAFGGLTMAECIRNKVLAYTAAYDLDHMKGIAERFSISYFDKTCDTESAVRTAIANRVMCLSLRQVNQL